MDDVPEVLEVPTIPEEAPTALDKGIVPEEDATVPEDDGFEALLDDGGVPLLLEIAIEEEMDELSPGSGLLLESLPQEIREKRATEAKRDCRIMNAPVQRIQR